MKKVLTKGALFLALALALVGCGKKDNKPAESAAPAESAVSSEAPAESSEAPAESSEAPAESSK
ncbi:hypothetical protein [Kallipyga massiliensis]|uniref:hypothetical protein n=1 Tax=Kallipyga massiliensis TaxID=1472764 RepID=UPI0004BABF85|nr:hypothetical protein [Kallipyga massiliensis]